MRQLFRGRREPDPDAARLLTADMAIALPDAEHEVGDDSGGHIGREERRRDPLRRSEVTPNTSPTRESQQFAAIWSLITVLPPALTWIAIFDDPNGFIARALGWFPLTAPITMMLRLGTGRVPLWDFLVAVCSLAVGVYLAVRTAGALFRLGLLMYGKRPTLREILRQVRHAW